MLVLTGNFSDCGCLGAWKHLSRYPPSILESEWGYMEFLTSMASDWTQAVWLALQVTRMYQWQVPIQPVYFFLMTPLFFCTWASSVGVALPPHHLCLAVCVALPAHHLCLAPSSLAAMLWLYPTEFRYPLPLYLHKWGMWKTRNQSLVHWINIWYCSHYRNFLWACLVKN